MIKENSFFIKNIKNVVFLGGIENIEKLVEINKSLNLKTKIVTSKDHVDKFEKETKIKVFETLNKKFETFITKDFNIEQTLFVSLQSRWIFKKKQIESFYKFNLINYHPSRLPLYSGGAEVSWEIMRGDRINCQLFHIVNDKVDEGAVIYFEKSILPAHVNLPIDYYNISNKGLISLYKNFVHLLVKNYTFDMHTQESYLKNYFPRLYTKTNGWLDWNMSSLHLVRFINAFDNPYGGASTIIRNKRVSLKKVQLHGGELPNHPYMSGLVLRNDNDWIVVCTPDENTLIIEEVLNEKNENIISKIKEGDRFYTPQDKILLAKSFRARFGPKGLKK